MILIVKSFARLGWAEKYCRVLVDMDLIRYAGILLKGTSKEHFLPPNVPALEIKKLPSSAGVYYFHDKKGKVIYVGKARNLSKRVNSHFSNNKANKQKQEFLKKIYHVSYQETATELMAFILESIEIKKIWPEQNRSQKRFEQVYGLYCFEDSKGYLRLCIEKRKKTIKPLFTFNLLHEAHQFLKKLVSQYELCPRLCFLQASNVDCQALPEQKCKGACEQQETPEAYNSRVEACIEGLADELPSFALVDNGLASNEQSCILMEKGSFYGMGYLPSDVQVNGIEDIKFHLTPYVENDYIRRMVLQYGDRYPTKKILFHC
jgi:DNA polymerase-3 subunit epsilon